MPGIFKTKLKKGDQVVVLAGKYRGKTGKVAQILPKSNQAVVEGLNVVKRAVKPSQLRPRGGLIELTKPLHLNKLAIIDPATKKPSKIGYKLAKDGSKSRIYKSSGKEIK